MRRVGRRNPSSGGGCRSHAVERWRLASGQRVGVWLETVGELEALASLAGYRFERPDDVWPELVDGAPHFEAEALAHPLLNAEAVANDVRLGNQPQVLILSGSNMAGKSTLLRTIGVNAVLAQAGAPVRARRLRMSPLAVGASIRIVDSLQDGSSRFHAETLRLRAIFTDHLTNGKLRFDYRLRPGVVGKGNAIALMRSVGFEIPTASTGTMAE